MPEYERLHRLGEGNFGEVWLVYDHALGVQRAVKYVRPDRIHDPTDFYHEPHALMELTHNNIVRVEDAGKQPDGTLYIAMEYLPAGSVEAKYKGKPVLATKARSLLCDVCRALEYAHQRDYIHRDIKPANILIGHAGEGKLSDFGLAAQVPRGCAASPYGYLTHIAPEMFSHGVANRLTDIYALGVTAYRLVNGDGFLPQLPGAAELQDMVVAGEYPDRTHYRSHVPRQLRTVINRAMNVDADSRHQSASAFRHALERIPICCDWGWKQKRNAIDYRAKTGDVGIRVLVTSRPNGGFDISTTKRHTSGAVRRVPADCASALTPELMRQRLHAILCRYVTEGR